MKRVHGYSLGRPKQAPLEKPTTALEINIIFQIFKIYSMATMLVKGVSEDTLRRLKRLKIDLGCETWAELLDKLSQWDSSPGFSQNRLEEMKGGAQDFITLANSVSRKWRGPPSVIEESRRSRRHIGK